MGCFDTSMKRPPVQQAMPMIEPKEVAPYRRRKSKPRVAQRPEDLGELQLSIGGKLGNPYKAFDKQRLFG